MTTNQRQKLIDFHQERFDNEEPRILIVQAVCRDGVIFRPDNAESILLLMEMVQEWRRWKALGEEIPAVVLCLTFGCLELLPTLIQRLNIIRTTELLRKVGDQNGRYRRRHTGWCRNHLWHCGNGGERLGKDRQGRNARVCLQSFLSSWSFGTSNGSHAHDATIAERNSAVLEREGKVMARFDADDNAVQVGLFGLCFIAAFLVGTVFFRWPYTPNNRENEAQSLTQQYRLPAVLLTAGFFVLEIGWWNWSAVFNLLNKVLGNWSYWIQRCRLSVWTHHFKNSGQLSPNPFPNYDLLFKP
jgi:hypothetical protein